MGQSAVFSTLILLLSFLSGGALAYVVGPNQKTWCVAKPSSNDTTLLNNINYACSKVDCKMLQEGYPCFYPDNFPNHASVSMNLYYQANGRNDWNCNFLGSGLIVITDPSYENCKYA